MTRFTVPDMSCGHCTAAIEKANKAADATASVDCNLEDHSVSVESALPEARLRAAISEAGYEAAPA